MKEIIDLNNLSGIPLGMMAGLEKHEDTFRGSEFLEDIIEIPGIAVLQREIHEYCKERTIVGYHYTNAIPEEIAVSGLTCRSGHEIRSTFLKKHGRLFSAQELKDIKRAWESEFSPRVQKTRDSRLYFNFTTKELGQRGSELLLTYFGGEQVYWPLHRLESIGDKLRNIGRATVLKCTLDPRNLKTYNEYVFGKIAISSYHSMLNIQAIRYDEDGNQEANVRPENIEAIYLDIEKLYPHKEQNRK